MLKYIYSKYEDEKDFHFMVTVRYFLFLFFFPANKPVNCSRLLTGVSFILLLIFELCHRILFRKWVMFLMEFYLRILYWSNFVLVKFVLEEDANDLIVWILVLEIPVVKKIKGFNVKMYLNVLSVQGK